jgi:hypothetical protein
MVLAALLPVSPILAVLINNGSAIAAELNGFRPLMGPPGWQELKSQQEAIAAAAKQSQMLLLPAASVDAGGSEPADTTHPDGYEGVSSGSNGSNGNGHSHAQAGHGFEVAIGNNGHHDNGHEREHGVLSCPKTRRSEQMPFGPRCVGR